MNNRLLLFHVKNEKNVHKLDEIKGKYLRKKQLFCLIAMVAVIIIRTRGWMGNSDYVTENHQ